jgi:Ca2+-binding EF-hand superfamily protein
MNPVKPTVLFLLTVLSLAPTMPLHAEDPASGRREKIKQKILEKYDSNKDGTLSDEEKAVMKADALKKFDKNGDGKIDDAEKQAAKAEMQAKWKEKGKASSTTPPST